MTAAQLIEELKKLPPDTLVNVATAYSWSPAPVGFIDARPDTVPGVTLYNVNDPP